MKSNLAANSTAAGKNSTAQSAPAPAPAPGQKLLTADAPAPAPAPAPAAKSNQAPAPAAANNATTNATENKPKTQTFVMKRPDIWKTICGNVAANGTAIEDLEKINDEKKGIAGLATFPVAGAPGEPGEEEGSSI